MRPETNCPTCGKPVTENTLMGLCPNCLLKEGFGTFDTANASVRKSPPFVPPSPAELARFFPDLEIIELLGQGGMGAVYKARQKRLDRMVALKILPPDIGHKPDFAGSFEREAKALAHLHHPNIVTLYDSGQADGLFYFFMEYVDGMNLRQLLDSGHISPKEALAIVPQICDALQFAHDRGIIHRDIKPENILLNRQGQVKIADFGVAKIVSRAQAESNDSSPSQAEPGGTENGKLVGTPQYMAPEQLHDPRKVDSRADIYALGVVFYQMLTGELPAGKFEAPSRMVQIDVRLDEIVLKALQKNPDLRFQQASVFKTQIEAITPQPGKTFPPIPAPPKRSGSKKPLLFALIILTLGFFGFVFLAISLSFFWWRKAAVHENAAMALAKATMTRDAEISRSRSQVPLWEHSTSDGPCVLAYHDRVDAAYVFYYANTFSKKITGSNSPSGSTWIDEGELQIPPGHTVTYKRDSKTPFSLKVAGHDYDLRAGKVFLLNDSGQAEQLALFPALGDARSPENMRRLVIKNKAASFQSGFGPTIQCTLPLRSSKKLAPGTSYLIDFETGKIMAPPGDEISPDWIGKSGVDADADEWLPGAKLNSERFGTIYAEGTSTDWESSSPETITGKLDQSELKKIAPAHRPSYLPATFLFKTREDHTGVLQITGVSRNPDTIMFQYKMIREEKADTSIDSNKSGEKSEIPRLRFLAWQDEDKNQTSSQFWLPDGQQVQSKEELQLLAKVSASRVDISETSYARENPRFLFLWFSSPLLDDRSYQKVTVLDANGKAIPNAGGGSMGSSSISPSESTKNLGWITYTLAPGTTPAMLPRVGLQLDYSFGPWIQGTEIEATFSGSMALGEGAYCNGPGQDAGGKAFVSISIALSGAGETQFDFTALTLDGQKLRSSGRFFSGPNNSSMQMQRFRFDVPLNQVKSFQIQTRKIQTVTFKDIPLPP